MTVPPAIVLLGPRGSGKTSLGRRLAEVLERPFVDLDTLVLERLGAADVRAAWAEVGETGWREAEAAALETALGGDTIVLALGGGTPMIRSVRERLRRLRSSGAARLVYLECPAPELIRRLRDDPGDRPSLTGVHPAEEIAAVLEVREPTYRALADVIFPAWGSDAETLADRLAEAIA